MDNIILGNTTTLPTVVLSRNKFDTQINSLDMVNLEKTLDYIKNNNEKLFSKHQSTVEDLSKLLQSKGLTNEVQGLDITIRCGDKQVEKLVNHF